VSATRTTSDGVLQLTQTFKVNGAGRSFQVTMTLTNVSGKTVTSIGLRRQVDIDADAGGANGTGNFTNLFGATSSSVFAYNDSGGGPTIVPGEHGLMLRSLYNKVGSENYGQLAGSATSTFNDTGCIATVDRSPVGPVDDGATFNMLPILSLPAGGTMTEVIESDSI
jgi:hypothetical protein